MRRGFRQKFLGLCEVSRQQVGEPEIGEHAGVVRHDLEGFGIEFAGAGMLAHLVVDDALARKHAPIRPIRRMRLAQNAHRLIISTNIAEGPAIGGGDFLVADIHDGSPLENGHRLLELSAGAKRTAIGQRGGLFARPRIIALGESIEIGRSSIRVEELLVTSRSEPVNCPSRLEQPPASIASATTGTMMRIGRGRRTLMAPEANDALEPFRCGMAMIPPDPGAQSQTGSFCATHFTVQE